MLWIFAETHNDLHRLLCEVQLTGPEKDITKTGKHTGKRWFSRTIRNIVRPPSSPGTKMYQMDVFQREETQAFEEKWRKEHQWFLGPNNFGPPKFSTVQCPLASLPCRASSLAHTALGQMTTSRWTWAIHRPISGVSKWIKETQLKILGPQYNNWYWYNQYLFWDTQWYYQCTSKNHIWSYMNQRHYFVHPKMAGICGCSSPNPLGSRLINQPLPAANASDT